MNGLEIENVVVVFKREGFFKWFRGNRDWWVLDWNKWGKDFEDAGIDDPHQPDIEEERFGIWIVNNETMSEFFVAIEKHEVSKRDLRAELVRRLPDARSWWDVGDLFPIMLIDCDKQHVSAFNPSGTPMERYIPDGWTSEFEDFATKSSEEDFPASEKFWINGKTNMLEVLNERGKKLQNP